MTPSDDPRAEERARRSAGDGPTAEQAARFAAARAAWKASTAFLHSTVGVDSDAQPRKDFELMTKLAAERPKLRAVRGGDPDAGKMGGRGGVDADDLGNGVL